MAKPPKPPTARKGTPPTLEATRGNLKKADPTKLVDLNFKVPLDFRKRMGLYALHHDLSVKDVLIQAFERLEREEP
jgi:hypothetical protein